MTADAVNECESGNSPPISGEVDATSRKSREASFNGADGVVGNGASSKECILKHFGNPDHPVCAAAVASRLLLDGAASPPISGGEWRAQFHSHVHRPRLQMLIHECNTL